MSRSVTPVDEVYAVAGRPIQHLRPVKTGYGIRMSWRDGKKNSIFLIGHNQANWRDDGSWVHGWTKWHHESGFCCCTCSLTEMNKSRYKWCLDRHKWRLNNTCMEDPSLLLRLMVTLANEYSLGFHKTGGWGGRNEKGVKKGEKLAYRDVASVPG